LRDSGFNNCLDLLFRHRNAVAASLTPPYQRSLNVVGLALAILSDLRVVFWQRLFQAALCSLTCAIVLSVSFFDQ
jgi:hypothetical protein